MVTLHPDKNLYRKKPESYLNRTNFRADLISRGQKNRISRGFNFANLVFSKTSRGFNFANSGFLKISRGFNFANSVLKQIFTKHLNIVKILKERRKNDLLSSVSRIMLFLPSYRSKSIYKSSSSLKTSKTVDSQI